MSTPLQALNHNISLEQAVRMTSIYRERRAELAEQLSEQMVLPLSETFNREAFEQLLAQPGCVGIRMYLGMDDEAQLRTLYVAVNDNEEDILPLEADETAGVIIETGKTCPPDCLSTSPLTS